MSGGRFNFSGYRIRDELEEIAQDGDVLRRWPRLAERLAALAQALYEVEHEIDWELSGDKALGMDDQRYEMHALLRLSR